MTPVSVHYRITRVVGEGAFGSVYEGERVGEGLSRRVALKLLHATHLGRSGVETRLRDEARMLALIQHRAIVRVDDLIKVDDAWCVVMEFVDGADLRHLLEHGPVPPRAAVQIAEEVASALHAAYGQTGPEGNPLRLVHRDIKPENVRLTPRGEVKLLDFGIARAEFSAREAATQVAGMGTVVYMSAERFRGEDTHAGDVYALGVTLFELLTGVPPGLSAADADRRPPGRTLRSQWSWLGEIDADLLALVKSMLSDEPEDRPTGRECARALADLRSRLPGDLLEDWAESTLGANALRPISTVSRAARAASTLAALDGVAPQDRGCILKVGQTLRAAALAPLEGPQGLGRKLAAGAAALAVAAVVAGGVVWGMSEFTAPNGAEPRAREASAVAAVPRPLSVPAATPPAGAAPAIAVVLPLVLADPQVAVPPPPPPTKPTVAMTPPPPRTATPTAPAPSPPAAAPALAPSTGELTVSGADQVRLSGSGGSTRPGEVDPGTYSATVTFPDGTEVTVTGVRVEAGRTTHLRCDGIFVTCAVSGPR